MGPTHQQSRLSKGNRLSALLPCQEFWDQVHLPSVMLLFLLLLLLLLLIAAVAAVGGLWPGVAAALGGFLLVNWYFVDPRHTLKIADAEDVLALFVFLAVGAIVSSFVALAARRAAEGVRARAEAEALSRLAGSSTVAALLDGLCRVLGLEGASVLRRYEAAWRIESVSGSRYPEHPEASDSQVELGCDHVLALTGEPVRGEDRRVLDAFARALTASIHLGELEAEARTAGTLAAANELRAAILSAVSHDLRTPIAAIKASVTSLLQQDVEWTFEARREFLATINEETDRLNALVGNLLDMSRLQAGALEISATPIGLEEVLPAALRSLRASDASVDLDVADSLPRVLADPGLLERALANLIQNALRFSPAGAPTRVTAGAVDGVVDVRVADRGPGVPRADRERLFMPFQRLGDFGQGEGVGLGLAVAKGFVEAMGGEVDVEDTPGGGLTFVVRLQAAE